MSNPIHQLEYTKRIADPVHGLIRLTEIEARVLEHPAFQRLRNITQLGIASYVFPGATHNRFTHSLGVLHNVTHMYDAAYRNWRKQQHQGIEGTDIDEMVFDPDTLQTTRLAALCHDLGHFPFSHNLEESFNWLFDRGEISRSFTHEELSQQVVIQSLGDILGDYTTDIGDMITGQSRKELLFPATMISGSIDADRMDYLVRDALHCGVKHGEFDRERLLDSIIPHRVDDLTILAFRSQGIEAIEQFLLSRHRMHQTIYFNPSVIGFEASIRRAYYQLMTLNAPWPNPSEFLDDPDLLLGFDEINFINILRQELRKRNSWLVDPILNRQPLVKVGPLFKTEVNSKSSTSHPFNELWQKLETPQNDWFGQDHWMHGEHKSQTILYPVEEKLDPHKLKDSVLLVDGQGELLDPTRISGDGQHTFLPLIIDHSFHRLIFYTHRNHRNRLIQETRSLLEF